jgi:hypothetical protein
MTRLRLQSEPRFEQNGSSQLLRGAVLRQAECTAAFNESYFAIERPES